MNRHSTYLIEQPSVTNFVRFNQALLKYPEMIENNAMPRRVMMMAFKAVKGVSPVFGFWI